jgi:hypothetical protein
MERGGNLPSATTPQRERGSVLSSSVNSPKFYLIVLMSYDNVTKYCHTALGQF